jgi:hypothetical protein
MLKSKFLPILAGAAVLGIAFATTPASAIVYNITSDNIGVACSPNCGQVTVTDNTNNTYTFNIDLASPLVLHSVGSGQDRAVGFDLTGVTGIASGPVTSLASSVMFDGFGTFNFGVFCSATTTGNICNPTGQSPSNDLMFSVNAPSGQNLAVNGFMAFDVARTDTGATGFADNTTVVPAPPIGRSPLVLLAIGGALFGAKLFGRGKKHRGTAIPYAAA